MQTLINRQQICPQKLKSKKPWIAGSDPRTQKAELNTNTVLSRPIQDDKDFSNGLFGFASSGIVSYLISIMVAAGDDNTFSFYIIFLKKKSKNGNHET